MRKWHPVLCTLVACAAVPPTRPVPKADWTHGAGVYVQMEFPEADWKRILKADIEADLGIAGFRVFQQPANAGELHLNVASYDGDFLPVSVDRDGEVVDRLRVDYQHPCGGGLTFDYKCIAREISAQVIQSPVVAGAMARKPAAPAAAAAAVTSAHALSGKLAVLDLRNFTKDLTHENAQYFTDVIRQAALKAQPGLEIMTRENLVVLLQATGKDLASCEGECEVDTGRRIGADAIVSGEIQKLGSNYKLTLRLHDTHDGRLLRSSMASGKTVDDLDPSASKAAEELFAPR